jgi:translation initiation factor IF-1
VREALPGRALAFRVELPNGHRLVGHVALRRRAEFAGLKPGDRVRLELSPFDLSKGRIVLKTN